VDAWSQLEVVVREGDMKAPSVLHFVIGQLCSLLDSARYNLSRLSLSISLSSFLFSTFPISLRDQSFRFSLEHKSLVTSKTMTVIGAW